MKSVIKEARPLVFFKEVRGELAKVSWPNKQEIIRLTSLVVGISVVVALFIASLDFIFTKTMEALLAAR